MPSSSQKLITIDTDNAWVRVYGRTARELGMSEAAIAALFHSAAAMVVALTSLTGTTWTYFDAVSEP
jgi:hypothetical protein